MQHPPLTPDIPENFLQQLLAARSGSPEVLALLLENFRPYLLLIADEKLDADLRPKLGASDLVQQSVIEAHRDFAGFCGATHEDLRAWLQRILHHNLADARRRYREAERRQLSREQSLSQGPGATLQQDLISNVTPPLERVVSREQAAALQQALGGLSSEHQQVLALRYDEGCSFAEIGVALGRSEEAAKKLWMRAVRRLREQMRGLHESNGTPDA
jgi:RNA polymerase sigma-70 factor (ECF subfamily)